LRKTEETDAKKDEQPSEEEKIPEYLKKGEYKPKIVDEDDAMNEENRLKDKLKESMKMLDMSLSV
jgi:hypothetical protein